MCRRSQGRSEAGSRSWYYMHRWCKLLCVHSDIPEFLQPSYSHGLYHTLLWPGFTFQGLHFWPKCTRCWEGLPGTAGRISITHHSGKQTVAMASGETAWYLAFTHGGGGGNCSGLCKLLTHDKWREQQISYDVSQCKTKALVRQEIICSTHYSQESSGSCLEQHSSFCPVCDCHVGQF